MSLHKKIMFVLTTILYILLTLSNDFTNCIINKEKVTKIITSSKENSKQIRKTQLFRKLLYTSMGAIC